MEKDQIILIDKPAGISSFGVVAKVRGYMKAKCGSKVKVGHTGTLDPFATGLLILLTGKNTKKSGEFLKQDKVYEATLKLGEISDTGDPEGHIREYLIEDLSEVATENEGVGPTTTGASDLCPKLSTIDCVLSSFTGKIEQTPPKFSAIKIGGQRAYKLARKGADFEIPSRTVKIYSIEILDYNYPELKIRCHVSSGTYIRTLAEDIGKELGVGAYLTELRRIRIGEYDISDALPLSHFSD